MSKKYYTLLSKSSETYHNNDWIIECGSYDKEDCVSEMADGKDAAEREQLRMKFKIITTDDTQDAINQAVMQLNGE